MRRRRNPSTPSSLSRLLLLLVVLQDAFYFVKVRALLTFRRGRIRPIDSTIRDRHWVQFEDEIPESERFYPQGSQTFLEFPSLLSISIELNDFQVIRLEQEAEVKQIEQDEFRTLVEEVQNVTNATDDYNVQHNDNSYNDYAIDWGFTQVQAQDLHNQGIRGQGVKICLIDTGVEIPHPDLNTSAFSGISLSGWDQDVWRQGGHGTHIAGIIAADDENNVGIKGVAPDVDIIVYQFFDDARSSDLVFAVDQCVGAGARIINISVKGTRPNGPERERFRRLFHDENVLVVAPAGNGGRFARAHYPASYDDVISVAAVDPLKRRAFFSQSNRFVDLAAPGWDIYSTVTTGDGYGFQTGTTQAAAFVSGVAALLWSYEPSASAADIRDALFDGALDLGVAGHDNDYGYGLVQALGSLSVLTSTQPPSLTPTATPFSSCQDPSNLVMDRGGHRVLIAQTNGTRCAEFLRFGTCELANAISEYFCTDCVVIENQYWEQRFFIQGTELFALYWKFAVPRTIPDRFDAASSVGELVRWEVVLPNNLTFSYKEDHIWFYSSSMGGWPIPVGAASRFVPDPATDLRQNFSADDGCWGAGEGIVDGGNVTTGPPSWGQCNFNSADTECISYYFNGVTLISSDIRSYLYVWLVPPPPFANAEQNE